jgi:hypothetical protein
MCTDRQRSATTPRRPARAACGQPGVATGTQRIFGYFTQGILQADESGLYAFSGDYLVVNSNGSSLSQPPVAAIKAQAVPSATAT